MIDTRLFKRTYLLGFVFPVLFIYFQAPCVPLDARPESDENPLGARHEITADIEGDEQWMVIIQVFLGPNEGENSLLDCNFLDSGCEEDTEEELVDECSLLSGQEAIDCILDFFGDGECDPDCVGSGDETVSWSYRGTGGTGTDYIAVCALDFSLILGPGDSSVNLASGGVGISQLRDDDEDGLSEEELEEEIEFLEEFGCDVVTKTWDEDDEEPEEEPRFLGGGVVGAFPEASQAARANRERAQAAAAAAVAAPRPAAAAAVRPPSTGDGGIK